MGFVGIPTQLHWPKKVPPHFFKIQVEQARSFFFEGVYIPTFILGLLQEQKMLSGDLICSISYTLQPAFLVTPMLQFGACP